MKKIDYISSSCHYMSNIQNNSLIILAQTCKIGKQLNALNTLNSNMPNGKEMLTIGHIQVDQFYVV